MHERVAGVVGAGGAAGARGPFGAAVAPSWIRSRSPRKSRRIKGIGQVSSPIVTQDEARSA